MEGRGGDGADDLPVGPAQAHLAAGGDGDVLGAVEMEHHQAPRRLAQVQHLRDGLLAAIAALGGVHAGAQQVELVRDGALVDLARLAGAMVRDPHRLPGAHPGQLPLLPGQRLERRGGEDREDLAGRVLGRRAVGDAAGGDLGPGLGPHGDGLGQVEVREHLGRRGESAQDPQVVAIEDLDPGGEAHHLQVAAQSRARPGVEDQQQRLLADHDGRGEMLDAALRGEHREGGRGADGRAGEDLGGDRGHPAAGVGAADLEQLELAEVDDGLPLQQAALLAQRGAVVGGHGRVRALAEDRAVQGQGADLAHGTGHGIRHDAAPGRGGGGAPSRRAHPRGRGRAAPRAT